MPPDHVPLPRLLPRTVAGKFRLTTFCLLAIVAANVGFSRWTTSRLQREVDEIQSALKQQGILWETYGRLEDVRRDIREHQLSGAVGVDSLLAASAAHAQAIRSRLTEAVSVADSETAPAFVRLRGATDTAFAAWSRAMRASDPDEREESLLTASRLGALIFDDLLPTGIRREGARLDRARRTFDEVAVRSFQANWLLFGASCVLALLVLGAILRRVTSRVRRLEVAASRIGGGDLSHRIPVTSSDELSDVARAFNRMAGGLERALAELRGRHDELDRTLRLLVALVDNMPAGVMVEDLHRRILQSNRRFWTMIGREGPGDGSVGGGQVFDVLRCGPAAAGSPLMEVLAHPRNLADHEIELPDGKVVAVDCVPVSGSGEGVEARMWLFRDVTEQRRAREDLRRSEARFRRFFEDASDALFLHDHEGRIIDGNRRACESLGYSRAELLGRTVADFELNHDAERLASAWANMEVGQTVELEGVHRRKDGSEFPVDVRLRLFEVDGRRLVLADVRDVTERRRLEERLAHAGKMQAVGRLAGGIAHDFNNVLTAIRGHAQFLQDTGCVEGWRDDVVQIDRSAERAAELVAQLLAFSRQQVLQPAVISPFQIIDSMEMMLGRLIREDIILRIAVPQDVGCIRVDPGQLEQVILNLVINACDAMPAGGKLDVMVRNEDTAPAEYAAGPAGPGGYVCLTVQDTGSGISPEVLPRIFEPFFTTKAPGDGSGLGLATVHGVVRQSGGDISVHSEPGRGSRFQVWFPRVDAPAEPAAGPANGAKPPGDLTACTVLVVEDETPVRSVMERILVRAGCRVLTAGDGDEALRILEALEHPLDLLITDMVMPGLGGAALADAVSVAYKDLPVLFVSGYTEEDIEGRGLPGVFLAKPFTPSALVDKVTEMLRPS